jgi:hypothetical protein
MNKHADVIFTHTDSRFLARHDTGVAHTSREQVWVKGILSELDKFDLVVSSLLKDSLRQVTDLLENLAAAAPYKILDGPLIGCPQANHLPQDRETPLDGPFG